MKKIDPKLPIRTRDGRPVTILTTEARDLVWTILGYIGDSHRVEKWRADGSYCMAVGSEDPKDLVQDREVWVNIYDQEFLAVFSSKEAAQRSHKQPVARVRVPYTPGQFDE